jgi:putative transposase
MSPLRAAFRIFHMSQDLVREALRFFRLTVSARASLAAEVLFLRKQLAFYHERKIKPRRFDDCARISLLLLAKLFDWKNALVNVKPETFVGWHKQAPKCKELRRYHKGEIFLLRVREKI